eukprot:249820-Amphidinium_carterae.2
MAEHLFGPLAPSLCTEGRLVDSGRLGRIGMDPGPSQSRARALCLATGQTVFRLNFLKVLEYGFKLKKC